MLRKRLLRASLLVLALGCAACEEGPRRDVAKRSAGVRRYTLRGEVVGLPEAKDDTRHVALRHEAIHDFEDSSGKIVGMDAMVMPFELAPDVSLDDVRVGEPVEVVFAVDWAGPSLRVERLRKLPAGTVLTFGRARPGTPAR